MKRQPLTPVQAEEAMDPGTALYIMLAATLFLYHQQEGMGIEAASEDFQRVAHALNQPSKDTLS